MGSTLTATPPNGSLLQWFRGTTAISGANGLAYTLTSADLGQNIQLIAMVPTNLGLVTIALNALSLANATAAAGGAWFSAIQNATAGSTITATSSDGTTLNVASGSVTGTFATSGSKTITLTETLAGATNSPRQSQVTVTVSAAVLLTPPAGLGLTPPFNVYRTAGGVYSHDFDPASVKPVHTVTVYCGAGGDNTKDGLSWANRVRSLGRVVERANAQSSSTIVRILAQVGMYRSTYIDPATSRADSFNGTQITRNVVIEPCDENGNPVATGQVVSTHEVTLPAFTVTSDPNIYACTYTTEIPAGHAWDESFVNDFGRPLGLVTLHSSLVTISGQPYYNNILAGINAMWTTYGRGAIYHDATNKVIYVRTKDNRAPDPNIHYTKGYPFNSSSERNFYAANPVDATQMKIWGRNIDLWGGRNWVFGNEPTARTHDHIFVDVYSGYNQPGAHIFQSAGRAIRLRCTVADEPGGDGFTYYQDLPDQGSGITIYELDCVVKNAGQVRSSDSSTNASSFHKGCKGVRVNNTYRNIENRIVHDIEDARSWNCGNILDGTIVTGRASGGYTIGFLAQPTSTALMWVDGGSITNMDYALEAYNGGQMFIRNLPGGLTQDVESGSVSAY